MCWGILLGVRSWVAAPDGGCLFPSPFAGGSSADSSRYLSGAWSSQPLSLPVGQREKRWFVLGRSPGEDLLPFHGRYHGVVTKDRSRRKRWFFSPIW